MDGSIAALTSARGDALSPGVDTLSPGVDTRIPGVDTPGTRCPPPGTSRKTLGRGVNRLDDFTLDVDTANQREIDLLLDRPFGHSPRFVAARYGSPRGG